MDLFGFVKKLIFGRKFFLALGKKDGARGFPAAGHGVLVPTYFAVPDADPPANSGRGGAAEQWKEAANG